MLGLVHVYGVPLADHLRRHPAALTYDFGGQLLVAAHCSDFQATARVKYFHLSRTAGKLALNHVVYLGFQI